MLRRVSFKHSKLSKVIFGLDRGEVGPRTTLMDIDLSYCDLVDVSFNGVEIRNLNLKGSRLVRCDFSKSKIRRVNFDETRFDSVIFTEKHAPLLGGLQTSSGITIVDELTKPARGRVLGKHPGDARKINPPS
ncbi:hypothetical protein EOA32_31535 [Mesorhizobium sp. M1A.F.Ca.ET.072.01.1.1]|nr:hypothetical protein EOA32_31535 [Mesorhizobium sp. M1A.F.Ca.ET.072.01.1.1]TIU98689.1 MAG: pentapeptide repeat-containing protein [Mesorhizobium sp.]